jgi:REP element-mobilizing transposase RayT
MASKTGQGQKRGTKKGTRLHFDSFSLTMVGRKFSLLARPRSARYAPGGYGYHALNRAVARHALVHKPADYAAFERVLARAQSRHPTPILAYCLTPNHRHVVLWPEADDELSRFLRRLTHTHTMRRHAHDHTAGTGHLDQGRLKAFPVEADECLYAVLRYVERTAPRAGSVERAEGWRRGQPLAAAARGTGPAARPARARAGRPA